MATPDIRLLDHRDPVAAAQIHAVLQAAYQFEAELIGAQGFAPLKRSCDQIACASSRFFGSHLDGRLAAVAELEACEASVTNVAALVVLPRHFRKGLGRGLMRHVLRAHPGHSFTVSTAATNLPALLLYAQLDFIEQRRWATDDGIAMLTLAREPEAAS